MDRLPVSASRQAAVLRISSRGRRVIVLTLLSLVLVGALYVAWGFSAETWVDVPERKADSWQWRLSMSLAYTALGAFAATLAVGPLAVLRGRPSPPHQALRRDLGIWTALLALAHISVSAFIHTDGWALWGLFLWHKPGSHNWLPLRLDTFGQANFAGLALVSLLVLLLCLSNSAALRRLKVRRWKTLQRLAYPAFGLVGLHGLLYQSVEQRHPTLRAVFLGLILSIILLQGLGAGVRLARKRKQNPY